jgi:hypothetical protein
MCFISNLIRPTGCVAPGCIQDMGLQKLSPKQIAAVSQLEEMPALWVSFLACVLTRTLEDVIAIPQSLFDVHWPRTTCTLGMTRRWNTNLCLSLL